METPLHALRGDHSLKLCSSLKVNIVEFMFYYNYIEYVSLAITDKIVFFHTLYRPSILNHIQQNDAE